MKISLIIPLDPKKKLEFLKNIKKLDVFLIIEKGLHPSKNRNKGIKKAKTELISFTNGHTLLDKNWSKKVKEFFIKYPEIDIVGGPQLTHKSENSFAKMSGFALSSYFGVGEVSNRYGGKILKLKATESDVTSANLICRRRVFTALKFDENVYPGEDPKFISDALKLGFRVAYSPEIISYNRRRDTLLGLIKQIFNYGQNRPKIEPLFETLKKPYFLIPSFFLLYLLLLPFLFLINLFFIFPLLIYLLLNFLFSVYESIKNKEFLWLLPLIFFSIHLSYGLGFIWGMIRR